MAGGLIPPARRLSSHDALFLVGDGGRVCVARGVRRKLAQESARVRCLRVRPRRSRGYAGHGGRCRRAQRWRARRGRGHGARRFARSWRGWRSAGARGGRDRSRIRAAGRDRREWHGRGFGCRSVSFQRVYLCRDRGHEFLVASQAGRRFTLRRLVGRLRGQQAQYLRCGQRRDCVHGHVRGATRGRGGRGGRWRRQRGVRSGFELRRDGLQR